MLRNTLWHSSLLSNCDCCSRVTLGVVLDFLFFFLGGLGVLELAAVSVNRESVGFDKLGDSWEEAVGELESLTVLLLEGLTIVGVKFFL